MAGYAGRLLGFWNQGSEHHSYEALTAFGQNTDAIWLNSAYISTEPLRTRQVAPARITPRGTPAGAWIVVPDLENAPLDYTPVTGFEEVWGRGPGIMDVWHDDFGYLYKGHYVPRSPWR